MNILVTGGAGFIGSHIVEKLSDKHEITVLDDLSNAKNDFILERVEESFFHKKSIVENLEQVFKNGRFDIVIHHAANVFVTKSIREPIFDANVNIIGSLNILENCRKYGVKKIIYANSGAAGAGECFVPINEKHPIKPLSPYGVSKHTVEHYLEVYSKIYGLRYTSLRYSNIYGPRQNPDGEGGVVAIFINKLLKGQQPFIFGDGKQTRDFTFVEDVVEANILAMKKGDNDYFNISTGKEVSVNKLFDLIKKMTGSKLNPIYKKAIDGEIKKSVLSCKKARKLGWAPKTPLEKGLEKTIRHFKK